MGYDTRFLIGYDQIAPGRQDEFDAAINDENFSSYGAMEELFGDWSDAFSWYDHESDMARLSKMFPETLFKLTGDGSDADDLWVKWFKGGKIQRCYAEIVYPPYDETKFKEIEDAD